MNPGFESDASWLPAPPAECDGRLVPNEGGFTADFRVRNTPRWLGFGWLGMLGLIIAPGLAPLVAHLIDEARIGVAIALGVAMFALAIGGVTVLVWTVTVKSMSTELTADGETLEVRGYGKPRFRIPETEIAAVRLLRSTTSTYEHSFDAQKKLHIRHAPKTCLEIVLRDGVMQLMHEWGPQETEWAVDVLAVGLGVPRLDDREERRGDPPPALAVSERTWREQDHRFVIRVVVVAIVLLTAFSAWTAWRIYDTRNWTTVAGEIVKAKPSAGEDDPAQIVYRYHVEEQAYRNDDAAPWPDGIATEWWVKHAEPGDTVKVYVDPNDPEHAALSIKMGNGRIGCHVLLHALAWWGYFALRRTRPSEAQIALHDRYAAPDLKQRPPPE
ncbi:MAG: DUF3592 domain-containing protein [Planctomycetota bacterium]